jgi:hypothetical protein
MNVKVKVNSLDGHDEIESLYSYCSRLSKKNNSILYLLESYLNKKLLEEPKLAEIRDVVLTVSADISKLNSLISIECGEDYEELQ